MPKIQMTKAEKDAKKLERVQDARAALEKRIPGIDQHLLLKEAEVSALTSTPRGTLSRWRIQGKGPRWTKLEGSVRYYLTDIKEFLEQGTRLPVRDQMEQNRKPSKRK